MVDEWCPPIPQVTGPVPIEGGDLSRASWLTGAELSFEPRLSGSRVHVLFVHSACVMNDCSMSGTVLGAGDPAVTRPGEDVPACHRPPWEAVLEVGRVYIWERGGCNPLHLPTGG